MDITNEPGAVELGMTDEHDTVGYGVWEICGERLECALPVDVLLCLYVFCALAIICEEYLVPASRAFAALGEDPTTPKPRQNDPNFYE